MQNNNTFTTEQYEALRQHILAMKDDAHFREHPEWAAIVEEAETGKPAQYDGPTLDLGGKGGAE